MCRPTSAILHIFHVCHIRFLSDLSFSEDSLGNKEQCGRNYYANHLCMISYVSRFPPLRLMPSYLFFFQWKVTEEYLSAWTPQEQASLVLASREIHNRKPDLKMGIIYHLLWFWELLYKEPKLFCSFKPWKFACWVLSITSAKY